MTRSMQVALLKLKYVEHLAPNNCHANSSRFGTCKTEML